MQDTKKKSMQLSFCVEPTIQRIILFTVVYILVLFVDNALTLHYNKINKNSN